MARAAYEMALDFARGKLTGWEGQGFALVAAPGDPGAFAASSAAGGGKKAILHRTFVVPANAQRIVAEDGKGVVVAHAGPTRPSARPASSPFQVSEVLPKGYRRLRTAVAVLPSPLEFSDSRFLRMDCCSRRFIAR